MKAKQVLKLLNISRPTLSSYVKLGKIRTSKLSENAIYQYNQDDIFNLLGKTQRQSVIYARVSTPKQKKDLENQINTLTQFSNSNGIIISNIYRDISSGMNLDRKSLLSLIDDVVNLKIKEVIITYKDRFSRVGFTLLEQLFSHFGCKIIVLNEIDNSQSYEKEIFGDIISLLHSFSMKMYSKRRKEKLSLVSKDLKNYD